MAENWGALSVGLPEDILKKKWAGDFKGALELIELVAQWVKSGGEAISAPTHFETTDGVY